MNVEIPSLSVSDMRRLKATDHVGEFVFNFFFPFSFFFFLLSHLSTTLSLLLSSSSSLSLSLFASPAKSQIPKTQKNSSSGTYTLFQETYHRPTFKEQHVRGPKSDYDHRLLTHDRAMRAGLDDVGVGVLFGLADYRYECLAIVQHAAHLEQEYGAGPHTIR